MIHCSLLWNNISFSKITLIYWVNHNCTERSFGYFLTYMLTTGKWAIPAKITDMYNLLKFDWDSKRTGNPQGKWASRRIHELNGPYQSTLLLIKFMHTNGNMCLPPPPFWHIRPWSQHSHRTCICKIKHVQINFMYILFPFIQNSLTDHANWAYVH